MTGIISRQIQDNQPPQQDSIRVLLLNPEIGSTILLTIMH